ncbi:MAG: hypothetical protein Q4G25_12695 [Paracoccus sp. (in: a-proteobacteria)]|nr:hypothetical protein [Paracoccus sp. (in: a-proteobacteria)]
MIAHLWIAPDGEVKLGCDVVGRITWANPCAYLSAAGEWSAGPDDVCWECFGTLTPADELGNLEGEIDELKAALEKAGQKIDALEAEIVKLREGSAP